MADENWTDRVGQHPKAPWLGDVDTTVALTVLATPDGDVTSMWRAVGSTLTAEPVDQAKIEVSIPWKEATQIANGSLKPAVAYMQGKLKPTGDMASVLALLEATSSDDFSSWLVALRP